MDGPKRVDDPHDPGYPTLADFSRDRRRFLQRMALGGVSVGLGGGLLTACDGAPEGAAADGTAAGDPDALAWDSAPSAGGEDSPNPTPESVNTPTGGSDVGTSWTQDASPSQPEAGGGTVEEPVCPLDGGPTDVSERAQWDEHAPLGGDDTGPRWPPETADAGGDDADGDGASDATGPKDASDQASDGDATAEDVAPVEEDGSEPLGGGAPQEQLFDVVLPATGLHSAYLADDGYLQYAIALKTTDQGLFQHLTTAPDDALAAADAVLGPLSCDDLGPDGLAAAEQAVREALEQAYAAVAGYSGAWIESLELLVDSCEAQEPLDGDVADPRYP